MNALRDLWENTCEVAAIFVPLVLLIATVLGLFIGVFYVIDRMQCAGFSKASGFQTRYEFACYANVDGKWVPKQYVYGAASEHRIKEAK